MKVFRIVLLSCGDLAIDPTFYKIGEDCWCYNGSHGYQKILGKKTLRFKNAK